MTAEKLKELIEDSQQEQQRNMDIQNGRATGPYQNECFVAMIEVVYEFLEGVTIRQQEIAEFDAAITANDLSLSSSTYESMSVTMTGRVLVDGDLWIHSAKLEVHGDVWVTGSVRVRGGEALGTGKLIVHGSCRVDGESDCSDFALLEVERVVD